GENVAHVIVDAELYDGEENQCHERPDEDKVDRCRATLTAREAQHPEAHLFGSPEMFSAFDSRLDSFGSATIHSAMTIPAVISVMRTQPGTSPRSSASSRTRSRRASHRCS